MLWTWPTRRYGRMWGEMDRLQREMNRLFEPFAGGRRGQGNFPAVNIWTGEDEALLTAEVPGVDPDTIEVTVKDDTVTIRGSRELDQLGDGESDSTRRAATQVVERRRGMSRAPLIGRRTHRPAL